MVREISVFAPAKINLFLDVIGRRADGYHDISSLMAKIALGDDLKISVQEAPKTTLNLKVRGPFSNGLKEDKTNLVYKSARAFFEHFKITATCDIRLEKNVPLASGLGAGSSDAAATMLALCALFNIEINAKRLKDLIKLCATLGADVPFFLHKETLMKAEGIGEKLTPVKNNLGAGPFILIANPNIPSDTKRAYGELEQGDKTTLLTNCSILNKLIGSIEKGRPLKEISPLIYNRLESSVFLYLKEVKDLKEQIKRLGAEAVLMSGSGASVFALFEEESTAKEVADKLRSTGKEVFLTRLWRASI